jgi:hypothetical protein
MFASGETAGDDAASSAAAYPAPDIAKNKDKTASGQRPQAEFKCKIIVKQLRQRINIEYWSESANL